MPIRPENRHHYTRASGWSELRRKILERAKARCEQCGVRNHAHGWRDRQGRFHPVEEGIAIEAAAADGHRVIRIVLTIAHLDQDPANRDPRNLAALCQRCHLTHDGQQHATNSARTRAKQREIPGQTNLFGEPLT